MPFSHVKRYFYNSTNKTVINKNYREKTAGICINQM